MWRVAAGDRCAIASGCATPHGANGPADTPGSVHRALARHRLDGHLSRDCVAAALQRPTRERDGQPHRSLSGLAPDEVYRADRVTAVAGGLLPHRFTLTAGRSPRRSAFCGTVSRVAPGGCYPPSCPAEPGRSSASDHSDDAAVLPTRSRFQTTARSPVRRRTPRCARERGRTRGRAARRQVLRGERCRGRNR